MRTAEIKRNTSETQIELSINLDSAEGTSINTGCGFLDHMLVLFSAHSGMGLNIKCTGDTHVDYHHTVEDIGICLGMALKNALGDKKGITRYGHFILPMDEALILTAIDLSGRGVLAYDLEIPAEKVGDFDTELAEEFFYGFVRNAECALHIKKLSGTNSHHILEGAFKSVARSIKQAVAIDTLHADEVPSTKGVL